MAKPLDLSREKGIGDVALVEAIGETPWPDFHGSEQLPTRGNPPDFVEPVAQIQAELLDGLSATCDGARGPWPAEAEGPVCLHGFSPIVQ